MKQILFFLFLAIASNNVSAQQSAEFNNLTDEHYAMIHPMMRSIEIENIEPDGWFFHSNNNPTEVVLNVDGESLALGAITSVTRINDTLSLYQADTVVFGLSNLDYNMKEKGALHHTELGRLGAIGITPTEKVSWIVFDKNSTSKNNNPPGEKLLVTDKILWKTEGSSNLPGIISHMVDSADNNTKGRYFLSVQGPWPWKRCYGSFELEREERLGATKTVVYEPNPKVGMKFTSTKKGYTFENKKFKKLVILREVETRIGGTKTTKHKKRTKI